jgi:predicted nucleotidyltransferase
MCTVSQLNEISRVMAEAYRSVFGSDIMTIYLYGSYARGDYDSESDIDLAAIVKGDRRLLQDKLKKVWDISADVSLENDIIISPTVIPYDEFEEYKSVLPYYRNIEKEGQKIG